jgi:serine/threonine protein phosphatase PrpC
LANSYPISEPGLILHHAYLTDTGCKRQKNEDAAGFFTGDPPSGTYLLVVADGVGGSAAGEVASQLAVDSVGRVFFQGGDPPQPEEALREAIQAANRSIYEAAARDPLRAGMATTCTAAVLRGVDLWIGHVGDCRAYLVADGLLTQLTQDHSLAADYERQGQALPPEKQSLANVLTRWLGTDLEIAVDVTAPVRLKEDSNLVLCSDGLTKVINTDEILHTVSMHLPERACRRLVDLARERGGPDNITVQVARISRY